MSWHGIGLISGNLTPLIGPHRSVTQIASIAPSLAWTGAPGSGFSTVPADPVRVTAKPALRLLVPPYQWFTSGLDVGVLAAANEGGTLHNSLGIAQVRFMFEGEEVVVTEPRWHTIDTGAGRKTYLGWWVRLQRPTGRSGTAQLYIEATARDATMQKRVIGPFPFSPKDALYDLEIEVNPDLPVVAGQRFQNLYDATSYAKAVASQNTLCTITKAGRYDIGDNAAQGINAWDYTGYFNITSTVPVTIGRETPNQLFPNRLKLRLFGNVTLDRKDVFSVVGGGTAARGHWCDGITITDTSPLGRDQLWDGGVRNTLPLFGNTGAWVTECDVSQIYSAMTGARLVRGTTVIDHGIDVINFADCVVGSTFERHDDTAWNTDVPAVDVRYFGEEPTATIARSGGTEGFGTGGGIYTVAIGATSYTFDVGNGSFGSASVGVAVNGRTIDGWFFADLVDWLNTLPDVTATLLIDPDSRANTGSLPNLRGQGFAPVSIKGAALTLQSHHDKHGDFFQVEAGSYENGIVMHNVHRYAQTQNVFLSPLANGQVRDLLVFGNIMDLNPDRLSDFGDFASQIGRPNVVCSHVVVVHNTFPDQQWLIRTDGENATTAIDDYSLFARNVTPAFSFAAGRTPSIEILVTGNRLYDDAGAPQGGVDNLSGGNKTNLFVNPAANDYRPAGALLEAGFAPLVPFDMNRTPFPAPAAVGALAAPAPLYLAPPTFTASSISGTPTNGSVLTASYTALGAEPISAAYQWRRQVGQVFADIVGQTGRTITLDRIAMGIFSGTRVICRITLTNAARSAVAEPFVTFDGGEREALIAQLTGKANSGFYDFREATNNGPWVAANVAGGLGAFSQTVTSAKPGISQTVGAVFPGQIFVSAALGNYSLYILLRKDPAHDVQGHVIDAVTLYDPGSGATMSYPMRVDGSAAINDRATLHASLDDGAWHILSRTGTPLPKSGAVGLGKLSPGSPDMDVLAAVFISEADFPTGLANAQADALSWLEALRIGS